MWKSGLHFVCFETQNAFIYNKPSECLQMCQSTVQGVQIHEQRGLIRRHIVACNALYYYFMHASSLQAQIRKWATCSKCEVQRVQLDEWMSAHCLIESACTQLMNENPMSCKKAPNGLSHRHTVVTPTLLKDLGHFQCQSAYLASIAGEVTVHILNTWCYRNPCSTALYH